MARIVLPGVPYHVTHRGNERRDVFFCDRDRQLYLADLAVWANDAELSVWGYCLMSNHVHLLVVPRRADSLARAVGMVHQRHARRVHAPRGWTGHLWANRFHSTPLDESHLWTAVRYIELNPVRAGLVARAEDWPWSSAAAHLTGGGQAGAPLLAPERPFGGVQRHPLDGRPIGWAAWLAMALEGEDEAMERLRQATNTGRPCGDEAFTESIEARLGRSVGARRRGRKPTRREDEENQLELFK
ncbi:transposase [bacterium]|nr:transposase [bacterium]